MAPAAARDAVQRLLLRLANLGAVRLFLLLLALGIAVRTLMLMALDVPLELQFAEMERIGRHLFRRGAFADPYKVQTGPTAHHAPIYPFLVSLLFKTFGLTVAAGFAMAVMNFVFAALQWALVPIISVRSQLPRTVGVAAALLGAALPYRFMKELRWEAALVGAVLAALTWLTLHWWQRSQPRAAHSLALGLAWGAGMMCSPNLLPVFLVTLAIVVITSGRERRRSLIAQSAVALIGMIIAVTPWTVRNYRALGAFVFVRSNFGLEFSVSNNPHAFVLAADNVADGDSTNYFHMHHPWSNREEAQALLHEGEVAYNRRKLHETIAWVRSDPGQFARLSAGRIAYFWFTPYTKQAWKNFVVTPLTVLAFYGMWVMVRRRLLLGYVLLAMWIGYPVVYYLVQTDTRYRYPIEWTFVLLGVYALHALLARATSDENGQRS
jgi:hypothetical protein